MGGFDFAYWNNQLEGADGTAETSGLYYEYGIQFPSERKDGQTTYYNFSQDFDNDWNEDEQGWGTNNNN